MSRKEDQPLLRYCLIHFEDKNSAILNVHILLLFLFGIDVRKLYLLKNLKLIVVFNSVWLTI